MSSDCPRLEEVSSFIDGELPAGEYESMAEHVKSCEICSRELIDLKELHAALGSVPVDLQAKQRVLDGFTAPARRRLHANRRLSIPFPIAASFLLIFGVSVFGNAYLGFRQTKGTRESVQIRLVAAETEQLPPTPAKVEGRTGQAEKNEGRSAAAGATTPAPQTSLIRMAFSGSVVEFVSGTRYRLNKVPKIYAGGTRSQFNQTDPR
jgi:anti-sigma factor RsiW